jgi:hypothetical protein
MAFFEKTPDATQIGSVRVKNPPLRPVTAPGEDRNVRSQAVRINRRRLRPATVPGADRNTVTGVHPSR